MTQEQNAQLNYAIQHFHKEYAPRLQKFADRLDAAGISHYSSGCGVKKVTYDIFPASYYVHSLIDLVNIERNHKTKSAAGLKDSSVLSEYNPAHQFIQYLQRWAGFAEEVMQKEGDSTRGVAAAQVKLMAGELANMLAAKTTTKAPRLTAKVAAATRDAKEMGFYELLRNIGRILESHKQQSSEHNVAQTNQRLQQNYQKAMQAASANGQPDSFQAA